MPDLFSTMPLTEPAEPKCADIDIFLPCVPPSVTAQQKRVSFKGGKVRFFKSKDQEKAISTFEALLEPFQPPEPVAGAVSLTIEATWPWRAGDVNTNQKRKRAETYGRIRNIGKPDIDNFVKELIDRLSTLCFIEDDSRVAEVVARKFWGNEPGIRIVVKKLREVE